jgi:hypothetical protein
MKMSRLIAASMALIVAGSMLKKLMHDFKAGKTT